MTISMPYLAELLSNQSQELILFPTEQCNFRCTYCYEDFKLGRMSNGTVNGIKALIGVPSGKCGYTTLSPFPRRFPHF